MVAAAGVNVNTGNAETVTVAVTGVPKQPSSSGVIEYVAEPLVVPVVVNVCAIAFPVPFELPFVPVPEAVQLKVVPVKLEVIWKSVASPEQIKSVVGVTVAAGTGFVITSQVSVPLQLYRSVTVTIYVASVVGTVCDCVVIPLFHE